MLILYIMVLCSFVISQPTFYKKPEIEGLEFFFTVHHYIMVLHTNKYWTTKLWNTNNNLIFQYQIGNGQEAKWDQK